MARSNTASCFLESMGVYRVSAEELMNFAVIFVAATVQLSPLGEERTVKLKQGFLSPVARRI